MNLGNEHMTKESETFNIMTWNGCKKEDREVIYFLYKSF